MDGLARARVILKPMSCPSNPNAINTMQVVCVVAPVITRAMGAHMITTIMNTAA